MMLADVEVRVQVWEETWRRFTGEEAGCLDWNLSIYSQRCVGMALLHATAACCVHVVCAVRVFCTDARAGERVRLCISHSCVRLHPKLNPNSLN